MVSAASTRREYRGGVTLLLAAASLLALYIARLATMSRVEVLRSDYLQFDAAGHLVRSGLGAQLYVDSVQGSVYSMLAAGDHNGDLLFNHAPLSAALAVPFSVLGQVEGHTLWSIAQLIMLAVACALVARAAPWPHGTGRLAIAAAVLVALAGAGTLPLLLQGQQVGEIALGLGAAYYLWRRQRLAWGGAALVFGAAVAKPHLALGLLAFLIGWRDRRVLAGAIAGAVVVLGASVLVVGWHGVVGFVATAVRSVGLYPATQQFGFTGFFSSLFGTGALAMAAGATCSLLALAGCLLLGSSLRRDRSRLELALTSATALSVAAAPHLLAHDLSVLAPMFVAMVAAAGARDRSSGEWPGRNVRAALQLWAMLVVAAGLDVAAVLPVKLTPVALVLLAWTAWRWSRRAGSVPVTAGLQPSTVPGSATDRAATVA